MQFSWTTFIIEIINFLILVWVLKRLLYAPIKKVIKEREKAIQNSLEQARSLKEDARALEESYTNRLSQWEQQKEEYKKNFYQDMQELKEKELAKLQEALQDEKQKSAVLTKRQINKEIKNNIKNSMQLAADFCSRFLRKFADNKLEEKIIDIFVENLSFLSEKQVVALRSQLEKKCIVEIKTAYPLKEENQAILENKLQNIFEQASKFKYKQEQGLLAGIDVQVGAFSLHASVRDELKFFAQVGCEEAQL